MIKPISPDEVKEGVAFPSVVIESFNRILQEKTVNGEARFTQDEVIALMVGRGLERSRIFSEGLLNVEDIYRATGWEVYYDKPGYNESYPAYFIFRKKKK